MSTSLAVQVGESVLFPLALKGSCPSRGVQDDDESGWLVYTSEHNRVMHVAQLAGDYMSVLPQFTRVAINQTRESPAVFKHEVREVYMCVCWGGEHVFLGVWIEGEGVSVKSSLGLQVA